MKKLVLLCLIVIFGIFGETGFAQDDAFGGSDNGFGDNAFGEDTSMGGGSFGSQDTGMATEEAGFAEKLLVVSTIELKGEYYKERIPDFTQVAKNAITSLNRYEINNDLVAKFPSGASIDEKLQILNNEGVYAYFNFDIDFQDDDVAMLKVVVYDTLTKIRLYYMENEYEFDQVDSLISRLQYEIPMQLKVNLKIIGKVISRGKRLIYFDLGQQAKVKKGEIYRVFRPGEELRSETGDVFGQIDEVVGVVEVNDVKDFYSQAEILIGRIRIKSGDWVEKMPQMKKSDLIGNITQVYGDQVSISLGKAVGVKEGSYYGIFKVIKPIDDNDAFRQNIGNIRITEVTDKTARGILTISDFRDITEILLEQGMVIEEVEAPVDNTVSVGIAALNATGSGNSLTYAAYQMPSMILKGVSYRFLAGMGTDAGFMLGAGAKTSIANSPRNYVGLDLMYLDGFGAHVFLNTIVPVDFAAVSLELNVGYLSATGSNSGIDLQVGVQFPFF